MTKEERPKCPHCGEPMLKWQPPPENTWNEPFQYVCFNDDCSYYVEGWDYMQKTRESNTSYRCRLNPRNNICDPIPVWTKHDLKDGIIEWVQGARHKVQGLIQQAGCSGQQAARLIERILCIQRYALCA